MSHLTFIEIQHNKLKEHGEGPYNENTFCHSCKKKFQDPNPDNIRVVSFISHDWWFHTPCFEIDKGKGNNSAFWGDGKIMFSAL